MSSDLPPLGLRGWSPKNVHALPRLPEPFRWARPNYGMNLQPESEVEMTCAGQRIAVIAPLVTGAGWLAATGAHRDPPQSGHSIWTKTFDRAVDYVMGWAKLHHDAIILEAEAKSQALLSRHVHRARP